PPPSGRSTRPCWRPPTPPSPWRAPACGSGICTRPRWRSSPAISSTGGCCPAPPRSRCRPRGSGTSAGWSTAPASPSRRTSTTVIAPAQQRFYAARLAGTSVFDPIGDVVAKVRDVVVLPQERGPARAVGFVVEVAGKRRVFLPLTRVTSISPGQVISTGLLNVRRFEKRAGELLVIGDLLDRVVTLRDGSGEASVQDIALDRDRHREWTLSRLHLRRRRAGSSLSRLVSPRGEALTVELSEVSGLYGTQAEQSAHLLAASYRDLNPAEL